MIRIKQATSKGYIEMCDGGVFDASYPNSNTRRGRVQRGGTIAPTITAQNSEVYKVEISNLEKSSTGMSWMFEQNCYLPHTQGIRSVKAGGGSGNIPKIVKENCMDKKYRIRKLTPRECGRLMGVNDDDITKMLNTNSNSQCYKQFGNSIVVDVLAAQFSQLGIKGVDRWNDVKGGK